MVEFDKPYIAERITSGCRKTYRVQIRRRVDGKQRSLCKTFRHLKNAKTWRNKKLAEIELHGFLPHTSQLGNRLIFHCIPVLE